MTTAANITVMASKKSKKTAESKDRHKKKTRSYRLTEEHLACIEAIAIKQRWTDTTVIEVAIEELGLKHGLWPPQPDSSCQSGKP